MPLHYVAVIHNEGENGFNAVFPDFPDVGHHRTDVLTLVPLRLPKAST